jgi:F0F1-type ATP synthase membrane subunit b/b'
MQTLVALQDILLKSLPTFFLLWILYAYIAKFFLRPLEKTLNQRQAATEGLRKAAEERIGLAERKTSEYQEALQSHAADVYRQQEQDRQRAMEKRTEILRQAREKAEERIARARREIGEEAEIAKKALLNESEQMAQRITRAILEPPFAGASPTASDAGMSPAANR